MNVAEKIVLSINMAMANISVHKLTIENYFIHEGNYSVHDCRHDKYFVQNVCNNAWRDGGCAKAATLATPELDL
jgi:hypothetical protein